MIPPLNSSRIGSGTDVGRSNVLNYQQWRLTLGTDLMHVGGIELHSATVTLGTIRPEDSGAVFCIAKTKSPKRLGMPVAKSLEPLIKIIGK